MALRLDHGTRMSSNSGSSGRPYGFIVGQRYRIEDRLGSGAFGEVFKGRDTLTGRLVAFKMELNKDGARSHLNLEHKIYRCFNECPVTVGIPQTYFCGVVGDYTVMVMDLLGPCLEELFGLCDRRFPLKTVCMIGVQIIERLQYMHSCGYLHRDIKPENFVMGIGENSHIVYIIDVGLAKAWRDSAGKHISFSEGKSLTGTARYVSINTHKGYQQSRRDDLESVTYLLMYFLRGSLPWQGLKSPKHDTRYSRIREVKEQVSEQELAIGFPLEFAKLVGYARSLSFTEDPNYTYCTQLLIQAMNSAEMDYHYEWNLKGIASDKLVEVERAIGEGHHHSSRNNTAVAMGGSSSMLYSSHIAGEQVDQADMSAAAGFSQNLQSVQSASYANFVSDMHDTFGFGDYY